MSECWILEPDTDHLNAHGVDYDLVPVAGDDMAFLDFLGTQPIDLDSIAMRGNVAACRDTELPVVIPSWPMMSRRAYDLLVATGPMPEHRFIPSPTEAVPGGERRDDLGILHLLEHVDKFDFERSRFTPHPRYPNRVKYVDELVVLPFGDAPVPAVFRLSALPTPLFVSERTRLAFLDAGVRGCEFWEPRRWM